MSLADTLTGMREASAKRVPPEKRAIMSRATEDLRKSGMLDTVVKPGDPFPSFALQNQNGQVVRSADLLAKGSLVLTVFRGVW